MTLTAKVLYLVPYLFPVFHSFKAVILSIKMFVCLNLLALFITNIFSLNDKSSHIITQDFLLLSSFSSFNKMRGSTRMFLTLTFHKRLLIMLFTFPPSFIISFCNSINPQIISSRSICKVYQLVVNKFWIYLGIIDFINLYINTFMFFF